MSKAVITGSAANRHIKEVIHVITGVDVDTVQVNTQQQQTEQPLLTARVDNQIAVVKKYVDDKVAEKASKAELASESASIKEYVDEKTSQQASEPALKQELASALAEESSNLKQYVDRKITQAFLTPSITGEPVDQTQILGIITKLMKELIYSKSLAGIPDTVTITHDWDEARDFEHIRVRYDGDSNPEGYRYVQAWIELNDDDAEESTELMFKAQDSAWKPLTTQDNVCLEVREYFTAGKEGTMKLRISPDMYGGDYTLESPEFPITFGHQSVSFTIPIYAWSKISYIDKAWIPTVLEPSVEATVDINTEVTYSVSLTDDTYTIEVASDTHPEGMYFRAKIYGYYRSGGYIWTMTPWIPLPSEKTDIGSWVGSGRPHYMEVYVCPDITAQEKTVYYYSRQRNNLEDIKEEIRILSDEWRQYRGTFIDEDEFDVDCSFRTLGNGDFRIEHLPPNTEIVGVYYSNELGEETLYQLSKEGDVLHLTFESPLEDRERWIRLRFPPYDEIRDIPITSEAITTIGTWFKLQFSSSYAGYEFLARITAIVNNTVTLTLLKSYPNWVISQLQDYSTKEYHPVTKIDDNTYTVTFDFSSSKYFQWWLLFTPNNYEHEPLWVEFMDHSSREPYQVGEMAKGIWNMFAYKVVVPYNVETREATIEQVGQGDWWYSLVRAVNEDYTKEVSITDIGRKQYVMKFPDSLFDFRLVYYNNGSEEYVDALLTGSSVLNIAGEYIPSSPSRSISEAQGRGEEEELL